MNSNTAKILAVAVLAIAAFLVLVQPWSAHRYDQSPAGQEARRLDERISAAIESKDTWDPLSFLGDTSAESIDYPALLAGMSHSQATQLIHNLRDAGASSVLLINVRRGIERSTGPEAIAVELPHDPDRRAKVMAAAAGFFTRIGQPPPPDLRQKYLYLPLRGSATTTTQGSG